jgi:hypothetical protein
MIVFSCPKCERSLRAFERQAGKSALCPCGQMVTVTDGAGAGLWVGLFRTIRDWFGWKCPHCRATVAAAVPACPSCNRELPMLVLPT